MSEKTNMYAIQKNRSGFKPTNSVEIKKLFGLRIAMGAIRFPHLRMYWDSQFGIEHFK